MKITKLKYSWLLLGLLAFASCSDDNNSDMDKDKVELEAGTADFSTYVALGNSLTAGYTDGALFQASQLNSLPNILAGKMALLDGGAFTQPMTSDNIGGLLLMGNKVQDPRFYLDLGSLSPKRLEAEPTTDISNIIPGPYHNMGVPGAKSFHLLAPGYGNIAGLPNLANPYFVRMASSPSTSVLADAMALNPTFFTLWIGNNDVLGYATTGGDGTDEITDLSLFTQAYGGLIQTLTSAGAGGVVANIPDITTIPNFTTVPYNPLDPSNPDFGPLIPTLNTVFAAINQIFVAIGQPERTIVFSETEASSVVIRDENLADISTTITSALLASPEFVLFLEQLGLPPQAAPLVAGLFGTTYGQARQADELDLLLLASSTVIGQVNMDRANYLISQGLSPALAYQFSTEGVTLPLEDKWVLLPEEQNEIKVATDAFNAVIENMATQAGLGLVDANALMTELSQGGVDAGNYILTSDLVLGGAFSLDGVHLTARGYAAVANEFLKEIDETYGSNFEEAGELVDVGEYPTNYNEGLR